MGMKGNPEDQVKTFPSGRMGSHSDPDPMPGKLHGTRMGEGSSHVMTGEMPAPAKDHKQGHTPYSLRNNLKGAG